MGGLGLRPRPPPPVYTFFCRFCGKGYVNVYSCRRHEKDAHGPRIKCSHCYKFTCPESRVSEMRNHLIEVHGVEAGPPPAKRTRRIWDVPEPTIRVPPSPMPSISMGHQATVDLDDLGADPDVSVVSQQITCRLTGRVGFPIHKLSLSPPTLSPSLRV